MLLSMDENGQIYQAAAHRPDGKGVERIPTVSGAGDVTLDSAYLREDIKREKENKLRTVNNLKEINNAVLAKQIEDARRVVLKRKLDKAMEAENYPHVQRAKLESAALQNLHGADFDQLGLSGYGKSSDGLRGKTAKDRAIEAALLQGFGNAPVAESSFIADVSPEEIEQYQLEQEAKKATMVQQMKQVGVVVEAPETAIPARLPETLSPVAKVPASVSKAEFEAQKAQYMLETSKIQSEQQKASQNQTIKIALGLGILFLLLRK